jgi:hypothetical protein
MEVSMKRRLAVLLAITLAVSPLWTVPARAAETAETGVTFDAEGAADTEPESEPETKPETEPEIEPETKPETEPEIEPETEPETKPETEPETEADVTDEDKGESAASGVTLDPETAAETEPEEITEPEVDATANDAKMSGIVTDLDDSGNVLHHYIDGEMVKGAWASITISGKAYKFYFDENGNPINLPRHPIIEDNVVVYSNTSILGRIRIGHDTIVGGNVWLTEDLPPYSKYFQSKGDK